MINLPQSPWFWLSGFSLSTWLSSNGLSDQSQLPQHKHLIYQLLDELSVAQYLQTPPCDPTKGVYTGAVEGWTSCEPLQAKVSMLFIAYLLMW